MAARRSKTVSYEGYDEEIQKLMVLLKGLGIAVPVHAEIRSDDLQAFRFIYYSLFADEQHDEGDRQSLAWVQAGFGDVAWKINRAWCQPGSFALRPHLQDMVRGAIRMNDVSLITDQAANKTCELYVGCLALASGWPINLEDPKKTAGGRNPDVILIRNDQQWSIAVKTIHSKPSQTLFDSIKGAVKQIERTDKPGNVFVNLKNRLNDPDLWPLDRLYDTADEANDAFGQLMKGVMLRVRDEIVDTDWHDAFQNKQARPLVAFMGQSLARVRNPSNRGEFVPIRFMMALAVPPLDREVKLDDLRGLDKDAFELITDLNVELQAAPQ